MPVDTSIYQNLLRPPKSVADYDAEWQGQQANALTLQKARNALAMQSQEMEAAQRSAQEAGAFNNALRGIDLNTPEGHRAAMQANPTRALPLLTSNAKLQDQYAETRGRDATAMKTMAEAVSKKLDMQRDQLRFVQTPQQAAAWMQAAYADPELGPIVQRLGPIEQLVQSIPNDPRGLQDWVLQASEGAAKLRERVNAEAMQRETVRHNQSAEANTVRGQNLVDRRQRDALAQSDRQFQTRRADDAKKEAGGVGLVGGPKLSAAQEREQVDLRKSGRQSEQMIAAIGEARSLLDKNPTASGIGSLIDAAGRSVGLSSQSAQVAGQLETLAGWMVANVPRMEGPQSNFDVENYKTMAAKIGNRDVPVPERVAALDTLEKLHRKYADINGTPMPAGIPPSGTSSGGPVRVNSIEAARKLPPGTVFIDPQGVQRTR